MTGTTRRLLIGATGVLAAGSLVACDDDGPDTETPRK
jgi:hypothetical protein